MLTDEGCLILRKGLRSPIPLLIITFSAIANHRIADKKTTASSRPCNAFIIYIILLHKISMKMAKGMFGFVPRISIAVSAPRRYVLTHAWDF